MRDENNITFNYFETYANQNEQVREGLNELKELDSYLDYLSVDKQCVFNPFLARGLEIYTGTIYEMFLSDQIIKSSIGSGGRYDNAIGGLLGTNENYSTVGISFGLDVIYTAIRNSEKRLEDSQDVDYYIVPLGTPKESLMVAKDLRKKGFSVEYEMSNKKLGKALNKANKEKIRNVVIIGEDEVKNNQIKIKDMITGDENIDTYLFR